MKSEILVITFLALLVACPPLIGQDGEVDITPEPISILPFAPNQIPGWAAHDRAIGSPEEYSSRVSALISDSEPQVTSFASLSAIGLPPQDFTAIDECVEGLEKSPTAVMELILKAYDHTPYFGLAKGPVRTFYDKSGSDLDLAVLASVMLERCNGVTDTRILLGYWDLPLNELAAWLRVEESRVDEYLNVLRIPRHPAVNNKIRINRFWLEAKIDGTWKHIDPAPQRYEKVSGRMSLAQLRSASGYDFNELFTAANPILGTDGGLKSINVVAARDKLNEIRDSLLANSVFSDRSAGSASLLPNWKKFATYDPSIPYVMPVGIPWLTSNAGSIGNWSQLSNQLKTTIEISHPEWDQNGKGIILNTADVAARQLTAKVTGAMPVPGNTWISAQPLGQNAESNLVTKSDAKISYSGTIAGFQCPINTVTENGEFEIKNLKSDPFEMANITFDGPFAIGQQKWSGPGSTGNFKFTITYTPTTAGSHTGSLNFLIKRNGTLIGDPYTTTPFKIMLSGKTLAFPASGQGHHFGVTQLRTATMPGASGQCIIKNFGSQSFTVTSVSVIAGSQMFSAPAVSNRTVAAQGSTSIAVYYKPTTVAAHAGTLRVNLKSGTVTTSVELPLKGIGYNPGKTFLYLDGQQIAGGGDVVLEDLRRSGLTLKVQLPVAPLGEEPPIFSEHTYPTVRSGSYVIPIDFGGSDSGGLVQRLEQKLNKLSTSPESAEKSQALLNATLEMMGHAYFRQVNQHRSFMEGVLGYKGNALVHQAGLVAQEYDFSGKKPAGFYIDIGNRFSWKNTAAGGERLLEVESFIMSAMEHGAMEQLQGGQTATSTTRMLERALLAPAPKPVIYKLKGSNIAALRSKLSAYPSSYIDSLESFLSGNQNSWVILPSNGQLKAATGATWSGFGGIIRLFGLGVSGKSSSMGMMIEGGYNGGYVTAEEIANWEKLHGDAQAAAQINNATTTQPSSTEPINLVTGEYYFDKTDVTIGQNAPLGVGFSRHYSSAMANSLGSMGYGWTHNWEGGVDLTTNTSIGLGSRFAHDAANAYVAEVVLSDLIMKAADIDEHQNTDNSVINWAISSVVANWCVDSLRNNTARVYSGNNAYYFSNYSNGVGPFFPPQGVNDKLEYLSSPGNAYNLSKPDGSVTEFRKQGSGVNERSLLSKVINADGLAITLTYFNAGGGVMRLDKVTDSNARGLNLDYTSGLLNKISTFGDTSVRVVNYIYDNSTTTKNLIRVLDPMQKFTVHEYTEPDRHLMTGLKDGLSRTIATNEYDTQGRAVRQQAYGDGERLWSYYFSDLRTVELDPLGGRTTYYFDQLKRTVGQRDQAGELRTTEFNFNNMPVRSVDAEGKQTQTLYDEYYHPRRVNYPDGTFSTQDFDGLLRPTVSVSRGGKKTMLEYDASSSKHRPARLKIFKTPTDANPRTTHYTYHTSGKQIGQVYTVTDPEGRTLVTEYDTRGAAAKVTRQIEVDNGAGTTLISVETRTVYNARGDLTDVYNERGIRKVFTYNSARQPVTVTDAFGTSSAYAITTVYDMAGNASYTYDSMPVPFRSGQTFNAQGKPLRSYRISQDGLFDSSLSTDYYSSEQTYDVRDWPSVTNFLAPSGIPWERATASSTYYANGRLHKTIDPLGRSTSFAMSPESTTVSVTDDAGFRIIDATDITTRQRIISNAFPSSETADPLVLGDEVMRLRYTHKPDGEISSLTNRRGKTYSMEYDGYGKLEQELTPSQKTSNHTYTSGGKPATLTRPDGSVITLNYYSESGLLHTKTDPMGTINHRYDVSGNLTWLQDETTGSTLSSAFDSVGRLQNFTDSRGVQTSYTWFSNGLLRSIRYHAERTTASPSQATSSIADGAVSALTIESGGRGYTTTPLVTLSSPPSSSGGTTATATASVVNGAVVSLVITNAGSGYVTPPRVSITLPNPDMIVTYDYYPDRSLAKVSDWNGRSTVFKYYQDGKLQSIERPNGTLRTFAYTKAGELALVAESVKNNPNQSLINLAKFTYNNRGQVQEKQSFPGEPLSASRSGPMTAVAGEDNELIEVNGHAQHHDLRGNLIKGALPAGGIGEAESTYVYDSRNRLVAMEGGHSFGYDAGSNRISVTSGGTTSELGVAPLGGQSQVLVEQSQTNDERIYVYTPSGQLLYHLNSVVLAESSMPATYYHYDITGSTIALSGDDGQVKGRISYTAYGEITSRIGVTDTRFLFCGAYGVQTDTSGLVYMRARYYHPYLCRFLNLDPIGFDGGLNWYAYATGNPLSLIDPNGREAVRAQESERWLGVSSWLPHSAVYVKVPVTDPATGQTVMAYYQIDYGPTLPFVQMIVDNDEAMYTSEGWETAGRTAWKGLMLGADIAAGAAHAYTMANLGGTTIGEVYLTSLSNHEYARRVENAGYQRIDATTEENLNLVRNVSEHIASGQVSNLLYNIGLNNCNQFARRAVGNGMANPPRTNAIYIPFTNIDLNPFAAQVTP